MSPSLTDSIPSLSAPDSDHFAYGEAWGNHMKSKGLIYKTGRGSHLSAEKIRRNANFVLVNSGYLCKPQSIPAYKGFMSVFGL